MKTICLFLIITLIFPNGDIIRGRITSIKDSKKIFYFEVLINAKEDRISTIIFEDKEKVKDIISFIHVGDSVIYMQGTGFMDIKRMNENGQTLSKRFKLPTPEKQKLNLKR